MHDVLVNRLGGLSLPRKSVVRLPDRPGMTVDVYRGRKTTRQQQQPNDSLTNIHSKNFPRHYSTPNNREKERGFDGIPMEGMFVEIDRVGVGF